MKTNTVVQEAIEKLTEKRNEFTPEINDFENGIVSAFNEAIEILKESLPKEREQILKAHWDGESGCGCNGSAKDYFDQTYNQ